MTVYCPCKYLGKKIDLASCNYEIHKDAKRAARLEWEHIVPAENFGKSFIEWREGVPACKKPNGKKMPHRKCAETNAEFRHMEGDLYNLWPIVGEVNGLRNNYSMAEIADSESYITFGGCQARVITKQKRFMPMAADKGIVARTYFYMDASYPQHKVLSDQRRKLFEVWNKQNPPSDWECRRAEKIEAIQGNENTFVKSACKIRSQTTN